MNRASKTFAMVVVAGVALDQWTKAWASAQVRPRGIAAVIPPFVDFRFVRNPGALLGLGAGMEPEIRRAMFIVGSVLVLTLIAVLHARTPAFQRQDRAALSLLAAGAAGNLVDRVRTGNVVDFIHVDLGSALPPATFNLADVFICTGVLLLALDLLRRPQSASHEHSGRTPQEAFPRSTFDEKGKA